MQAESSSAVDRTPHPHAGTLAEPADWVQSQPCPTETAVHAAPLAGTDWLLWDVAQPWLPWLKGKLSDMSREESPLQQTT